MTTAYPPLSEVRRTLRVDYTRSHTYHHMYTLYPDGDREAVLPSDPRQRLLQVLQLITVDVAGFYRVVGGTLVLALSGTFRLFFKPEWSDAIYTDDPEGRHAAIRWARIVVLFHLAVLALAVVLRLWMLPVVVTLGSFIANWWRVLVLRTMHTGLRDNVPDWRKCARTVKLDPFSRFIYWNMNYHIEHHMYAAVPCCNLPRLSREIARDMPKPRTILQAWREMLETVRRQELDPSYQYDTPVPDHGSHSRDRAGAAAQGRVEIVDAQAAASLGDLEPARG